MYRVVSLKACEENSQKNKYYDDDDDVDGGDDDDCDDVDEDVQYSEVNTNNILVTGNVWIMVEIGRVCFVALRNALRDMFHSKRKFNLSAVIPSAVKELYKGYHTSGFLILTKCWMCMQSVGILLGGVFEIFFYVVLMEDFTF